MHTLVYNLSDKPNAVELELELAQWTAVSPFICVVFCFLSKNMNLCGLVGIRAHLFMIINSIRFMYLSSSRHFEVSEQEKLK